MDIEDDDQVLLFKTSQPFKFVTGKPQARETIPEKEDVVMKEDQEPQNLSPQELEELFQQQAPALAKTIQEITRSVQIARDKIVPLSQRAQEKDISTTEGMDYLEVKYQLLLDYCIYLTYYMLLKTKGQPVADHPVLKELLRTRILIEKIKPLDNKLQYQIEKLLKMANQHVDPEVAFKNIDTKLRAGPNLKAFLKPKEEGEEAQDPSEQPYQISKNRSTHYEDRKEKKQKEQERALKRAANSRMAKFVNEMVGEEPEEQDLDISKDLLGHKKKTQDEEVTEYEETYFTRLDRRAMEKKEKSQKGARGRGKNQDYDDVLGGLEDFATFSALRDNNRPEEVDMEPATPGKKRTLESMMKGQKRPTKSNFDYEDEPQNKRAKFTHKGGKGGKSKGGKGNKRKPKK